MKKYFFSIAILTLTLSLTGCSSDNYGDKSTSQNDNYLPAKNVITPVRNEPAADSYVNDEPEVKKSSTGICHEKGSTYYNRTQNFVPFDSIDECLNSGGRLPKR